MSHTLDIKNLSLALEALSRIQGNYLHYSDIEKLLSKAIQKQKEVYTDPHEPPNLPPKPIDDIPF